MISEIVVNLGPDSANRNVEAQCGLWGWIKGSLFHVSIPCSQIEVKTTYENDSDSVCESS